jgi:hypothetical protein
METTMTTTPPPTLAELGESALQCLRPLRVFAQLEELLAAATVNDDFITTAATTRTKLEAELADLRGRLTAERTTLEGQVAAARSSLQSVTADLRTAREALAAATGEYEALRRRVSG